MKNFEPKKINELINKYPKSQSSLIHILHDVQNLMGYLSKEVQDYIAEKLNISTAKVYGVVTFYSYFKEEPPGKHNINICMGTACFVKGAGEILDEFESKLDVKAGTTRDDGKYSLNSLRCIGACGLAPVIHVDDKVKGNLELADVSNIVLELEGNDET